MGNLAGVKYLTNSTSAWEWEGAGSEIGEGTAAE